MLVARLNLAGWDISRESLAKIEAQIRWVADAELLCLAQSLAVPVETLLPKRKGRDALRFFFGDMSKP